MSVRTVLGAGICISLAIACGGAELPGSLPPQTGVHKPALLAAAPSAPASAPPAAPPPGSTEGGATAAGDPPATVPAGVAIATASPGDERARPSPARLPAPPLPPAPMHLVAQYGSGAEWQDRTPLAGDMITCDFRVYGQSGRDDATGEPSVWVEQQEPSHVTFAGLSTSKPRIKDSSGEGPLVPVRTGGDEIVLYDARSKGRLFSYNVSRRLRMALWTKMSFSSGDLFGSVSIGRCY